MTFPSPHAMLNPFHTQPAHLIMLTFKIIWSTPSGRFGWTTIEECQDSDDALCHFMDNVRGKDPGVPWDADIAEVKPA
jgi:hypothetical protein